MKFAPGSFKTIRCSDTAQILMTGYEQANMEIQAASHPQAVEDAYGAPNEMRERLMTYISNLEARLGIEQPVTVRYK
jgi:hypothetical protein